METQQSSADSVRAARTERAVSVVHDTLIEHVTERIYQRGDTVYVERNADRLRSHAKADTLVRVDTLAVVRREKVTITRTVTKISWRDRARSAAVGMVLGAGAIAVIWLVRRRQRRNYSS